MGVLAEAADRLLQDGWDANETIKEWQRRSACGETEIAGPMLVVHGSADAALAIDVVEAVVDWTAERFPDASVEYVRLEGRAHNAAMTGGQRVWMDWIADRFAGKEAAPGLKRTTLKSALSVEGYQAELNWWLAKAEHSHETP